MQIEIEVTGQKIKRLNSPGSVADTINYLTCHFIFFGEEWDNTVRTAYFNNQKSGERYAQIIADDGTCTVPWEALTDKGFVRFSVAGEREDYRITTDIESFYNGETVYGGEPSEPPTPSLYDQMIALAEQTKKIAELVREDADAGEFDGEPGKPGDPGRDGVSPTAKVEQTDDGAVITITDATGTTTAELKNGKEGNPGQNATDEQVRGAVDAYMAEHPVQVDTEDIIKLAIKNEASGAVPIVTTDSAEMGVQDLTMQGWTEQAQYEGKNLFEIPDITAEIFETKIECNITQPITISATNEVTVSTKIWRFRVKYKDGTYVYAIDMDSSLVKTFDASEENPIIEILYRGTYITSGAYRNVQIEYGESATAYEPYTGRKPSPSPDYPQEIVSAGKYNEDTQKWECEAEVGCGQLLNFQENNVTSYGITCESKIDTITINGTKTNGDGGRLSYKTNDFVLQPGTYTFSYEVVNDINSTISGIFLTKKDSNEILGETFTLNESTEVYIGTNIYEARQANDVVVRCMLNTGSTPLPYTPYRTPQTVTLASDRPLTKWDKLEKRNGQWGWVYGSAEVVFDGSEDEVWPRYNNANGGFYVYRIDTGLKNGEFYINNFQHAFGNNNMVDGSAFFRSDYYGNNTLAIRYDSADDVDSFKSFLKQNNIIFWAQTVSETFIPLSESEQSALNALTTYYPTTVLDNDQGCEMSVQYIADTKAYIDKKIGAIQVAIVNTI